MRGGRDREVHVEEGPLSGQRRLRGLLRRLKVEFFHGRDWRGFTAEAFIAELSEYIRWYREDRLKAFDEDGRTVYDTIRGRRERLGLAA